METIVVSKKLYRTVLLRTGLAGMLLGVIALFTLNLLADPASWGEPAEVDRVSGATFVCMGCKEMNMLDLVVDEDGGVRVEKWRMGE
jgi:hypothetical protein